MAKHILVLTGSPRKGGNSDKLADAFIAGAQQAGHTTVKFSTADKNIKGSDVACDYSKISISGCNGLRYSYGLGLLWNSPIGPLKFSYGMPANKKQYDKVQRFQFQIGTSF